MAAAGFSDAEKQALQDQERHAQMELDKRRAETAQKLLLEKLAREEKYTRAALHKINAQWMAIMRDAKSDELKREIEILAQTFERVLDRKEAVLQACIQELNEAEKQARLLLEQIATRSHMKTLDRVVEFHRETVDHLHGDFTRDLEALRREFMQERKHILGLHQQDMAKLKDIVYAMDISNDDKVHAEESEFASRRDELRSNSLDQKTSLKANLEGQIKELWDEFQAALQHYETSTAEKRAEFERLRAEDSKAAATIESQMKKLANLREKIAALKQRLASLSSGTDDRNTELTKEKAAITEQAHALKARLKRTRERDRRALATIAVQAKECEQKLQAKLEAARKVLSLAEVCRKLESDEEKVLPFYADTITDDEVERLQNEAAETTQADAATIVAGQGEHADIAAEAAQMAAAAVEEFEEEVEQLQAQKEALASEGEQEQAGGETEEAEAAAAPHHSTDMAAEPTAASGESGLPQASATMDDEALARQARAELPGPTQLHAVAYDRRNRRIHTYEALSNFWKRYNKVLLDKLAVERERALLEEENTELRNILKQYLDGISVSEEVLAQDNTLLIVNGRTNAPMNVPVGDSRVARAQPTVVEASHALRTTLRGAR